MLSRSFGATELEDRLAACAAQPDDPNLLYQAGYDLYEQAQFEAAGALLFRANVLAPGQMAIVGELAGALAPLEEAKAAGLFRSRGTRLHQRAGGPVPSNRFT